MRTWLTAAANILAAYPAALIALVLLSIVAPPRSGFLALAQIALPYLFAAAILLIPLAAFARVRSLFVMLVLAGVLAIGQFGDEYVSWPATGAGPGSVSVITWNMQYDARSPAEAVEILRAQDADLLALQELTDDAAAAIDADTTVMDRYPYRIMEPHGSSLGIALLSRYPISAYEFFEDPRGVTADIDLGNGRHLRVLTAHPMPGRLGAMSFDGAQRDEALRRIRTRIDAMLHEDGPLLVMGDFNVASSEPMYRILADGLRDVHREVGFGPGWTWRPPRLAEFGIGVLRIDYVLAGPTVTPRSIGLDCRLVSDHCIVRAAMDVP